MKLKVVIVDLEMPSRVKKWGLRIGIPAIALVVAAVAFAQTAGPVTFTTGQTLTAAELTSLQSQITALGPISAVNVNSTTLQSATTGTWTTLTFEHVQFDLAGEFNTASGAFTAKEAGYFYMGCSAEYLVPGGSDIGVRLFLNQAELAANGLIVSAIGGVPAVNIFAHLNAGDTLTCQGYQASGASAATNGVASRNYFYIARLY